MAVNYLKISTSLMRKFTVIYVIISFVIIESATAQIEFLAGFGYSTIINQDRIPNQQDIATPMFGLTINLPVADSSRHSFKTGIFYNASGYRQVFDDKTYQRVFHYIGIPLTYNNKIAANFSVDAGVEVRMMIRKLFNNEDYRYNYTNIDVAAVLRFNLFESRRVNLFTNFSYGLIPMLTYQDIDATGNFNGAFKDLHSLIISGGIKLTIFNYD